MKERLRNPRFRLAFGGLILSVSIAVAAAVLFIAQPWEPEWSDQPRTIESVDPLRLWIRPSDGSSQRQMTLDELHSKFPLAVELPGRMSAGYELQDVDLVEAGHALIPSGPDALSVRYAGDVAGLTFNQRAGDSVRDVEGSEEVRVGEVRGRHYTWTEPVSSEWLVWARCGRVFSLWSVPADKLSTADLVRIAESVGPEAC